MKYLFLFLIAGFVSSTHAQEGSLSGKVVDNVTKQAVVGAKIALNPSLRAISDFDGNYKFD
ncbi:MAG: carboxypeptidase-like regulatory domain-containing protein, partial [Crocinitomicaceae bacterium]|nr:carboxypeptidase-like regulatory domain-containing protein [Crocinitomicaceae bacterium]